MNLNFEKYRELSVEELMLDDYFVRSAKHPTNESRQFWEAFVLAYPEKETAVRESSALIKHIDFTVHEPPAGTEDRIWQNILQTHAAETASVITMPTRRNGWVKWAAAAAVTGIIATAIWWNTGKQVANTEMVTISTKFGEKKEIILPDNSKITMNANSTVSYPKAWPQNSPREVWIEGEAFFEVEHTAKNTGPITAHDQFKVHANSLTIEVLGTTFNVENRSKRTSVRLKEGSIKVANHHQKNEIVLVPGESITLDSGQTNLQKQAYPTEQMDSWRKGLLYFDNTSLSALIPIIENQFGYKVQVKNEAILNRTISGQTPAQDIDVLLKSLGIMMDLKIQKKDQLIIIQ